MLPAWSTRWYPDSLLRYLPNLISLARLIIVPFILRYIWDREYAPAILWCFIAGGSDALDGFLARRLRVTSRMGAYIDPIADKLLLSGIFLVLAYDRVIPWWVTAVVFGRDFVMALFFAYAFTFTKARDFPPTKWGKLSTAVQIFSAFLFLLNGVMSFGPHEREIRLAVMILTVLATGWSAIHYLGVGRQILKANSN